MIQNRITTWVSVQPLFSKWWCSGDILKMRRPTPYFFLVNLNQLTCSITDSTSATNTPPMMPSTISCRVITATVPRPPPKASAPTSPMKTCAGWALNHKNARPAPASAPQKISTSPAPGMCGNSRYLL